MINFTSLIERTMMTAEAIGVKERETATIRRGLLSLTETTNLLQNGASKMIIVAWQQDFYNNECWIGICRMDEKLIQMG